MDILHKDIAKLSKDVELIKNILMSEGELSDYAKLQLTKARKENEDSYISISKL